MKWCLHWIEETEEEGKLENVHWANNWEEVIGYFTSWISKTSNVIKGEVKCFWHDEPYGDGRPCLWYDITDSTENEE